MKTVRLILYVLVLVLLGTSVAFASKTSAADQAAEAQLKKFLSVSPDTKGWFNTLVKEMHANGKTVARRGQLQNYLWHDDQHVAIHFFTYGGGQNTHYIASINAQGEVVDIVHMLTQDLKSDHYFNVLEHEESKILATEETNYMHINNVGKKLETQQFVEAKVYTVGANGKISISMLQK